MLKKKMEENKEIGSPAWMTTYADMVTLLLCFFVLLYSYSAIDSAKFEQIMSSLQVSFMHGKVGVLESNLHLDTDAEQSPELDILEETINEFYQMFLNLQTYLQEAGLDDDINIRYEDRGIVLELREAVLFDSGRADLKGESLELLEHISIVLGQLPNRILVEGHTDNVPINQPMFPSNWELSVSRAIKVVRYLTEIKGLAPGRFVAIGYGEYNPIDTNETPEGRAHNRRVNIVISAAEENYSLSNRMMPDSR